jgi:hypothetical protein
MWRAPGPGRTEALDERTEFFLLDCSTSECYGKSSAECFLRRVEMGGRVKTVTVSRGLRIHDLAILTCFFSLVSKRQHVLGFFQYRDRERYLKGEKSSKW